MRSSRGPLLEEGACVARALALCRARPHVCGMASKAVLLTKCLLGSGLLRVRGWKDLHETYR